MNFRTAFVAFAALTMLPVAASAACYGSSAFSSCTDASGNSYTVSHYGNQTFVNGSNARTGSTWNQNSMSLGNSTYTNGMTNGRAWHENSTNYGYGRSVNGVNSHGQPYQYNCTGYGC